MATKRFCDVCWRERVTGTSQDKLKLADGTVHGITADMPPLADFKIEKIVGGVTIDVCKAHLTEALLNAFPRNDTERSLTTLSVTKLTFP